MSTDLIARAMAKKMQGGIIKYSNPNPVPINIGGISAGTTYTNVDIMTILDDLLYPYMSPEITFSSTPSASYQENGTNISSIQLNCNVVRKSNNITKIEYYKNGNMIYKNNNPSSNGGTDNYIDNTGINNSTTYYIKVYDDKPNVVTSNNIVFTYVYPMYIGAVSNSNPTESNVKLMTKKIIAKSNQSLAYTINNSRFCFAYPTSYGSLTSIKDPNNFEMISSFTKTNVDFIMLDNQVINYTLYVLNNPTTQNNFNITYIF